MYKKKVVFVFYNGNKPSNFTNIYINMNFITVYF